MGLIVQKGVPYPNPEYTIHELTDVNDSNKSDGSSLVYNASNSKYESKVITKSLTWAEYQALSEEEKNNGTAYFIIDVNGDGQNFQPVIYSEEEREIGVWIDGKPLYEKTISLTNVTIPVSGGYSYSISDLNIDAVIAGPYGFFTVSNETITIPFDILGSYGVEAYATKTTVIFVRKSVDITCDKLVFTIRYTKTTDQPGSGTWTPQGVPAHHYSTDEQVVGTWIDGKPLYEKTIKFNNKTVTMNENTSELVHGISDIDTAFVHEAYADFGGGENWSTAMNGILASSTMCYFQWKIGSTAIYLVANNLSFSASTDRSYLFVIRYTKSS